MLPKLMQASEGYGTFNVLNFTIVDDPYGGYKKIYSIGATFEGVLHLDDSINAQIAEKNGVTGVYTLTTDKEFRLPWHTVFCKDGNTNKAYRVTTKDENSTPNTTPLNLRQVRAEEYDISKDTEG